MEYLRFRAPLFVLPELITQDEDILLPFILPNCGNCGKTAVAQGENIPDFRRLCDS